VILQTPTGSGKSLVALGLHFQALCERRRSFYTAPTKALVNEKFFALCEDLGPERVGMLTGDASLNREAPVICCTAEVLARMALREGPGLDAPYVVMDEFHYYGDRERGAAWQAPLLVLGDTQFLLMSATLGDTRRIAAHLHHDTGREAARIESEERPVPLAFEYRETRLHETVETLLEQARAPLYVVHFTQRECAESAQGLTGARLTDAGERRGLARVLEDFRFDTPYGRDVQRFLRHGVGIHHAGLLPRYRLLVEQLAQQGILKVICGTDTLGVGINVPIRTVVFSRLSKFDGEKVGILSVREFKQIAGRAGRKGFDEQGWVVCQAPEHVIEARRRSARPGRQRRKPPPRGFVAWNRDTFARLAERPPEPLEPRFEVDHGLIVAVLQRSADYRDVADLIARCHLRPAARSRLRRQAAQRFRSLRRASIVRCVYDPEVGRRRLRVDPELQWDFSLHHSLSLFLLEAAAVLDPAAPDYALQLLTLAEAILEDPTFVLRQQARRLRGELLARLKAAGVPYEERLRELDEVTHPKPDAEFVYAAFSIFAASHPWVGEENIRPKSVAREMFEGYRRFDDYVRELGLQRGEGVLLRYLGQVLTTLQQGVPAAQQTDEVHDAVSYLRTLVTHVDASLLEAWERRRSPLAAAPARPAPGLDLRAFRARVRAELHQLVQALAAGDYDDAARRVAQDPDDPWDAARFGAALAPFLAEYGHLVFGPPARQARLTHLRAVAPSRWDVTQVLLDPEEDNLWCVEGWIGLAGDALPDEPLVHLRRIGP
jgi:superfamily II RNA helicase